MYETTHEKNMTDGELLELAAKAAGINPVDMLDDIADNGSVERNGWNPLADDGDALRLAVKCGIEYRKVTMPHSVGIQAYDGSIMAVYEPYVDDIYAATRRAIVRAAAEIGKAMSEKIA